MSTTPPPPPPRQRPDLADEVAEISRRIPTKAQLFWLMSLAVTMGGVGAAITIGLIITLGRMLP